MKLWELLGFVSLSYTAGLAAFLGFLYKRNLAALETCLGLEHNCIAVHKIRRLRERLDTRRAKSRLGQKKS